MPEGAQATRQLAQASANLLGSSMDAVGGIPAAATVAARIGASIMAAPCHGSDAQDSFAPMAAHLHAVASAT
jgi:hypothetical protein